MSFLMQFSESKLHFQLRIYVVSLCYSMRGPPRNNPFNKPGRANRCVRSGFVYEINAFHIGLVLAVLPQC